MLTIAFVTTLVSQPFYFLGVNATQSDVKSISICEIETKEPGVKVELSLEVLIRKELS